MNKSIARAALLSASLSLLTGSASAGTFNINSASTTAQTLSGGQTGTVTSSGTLTISGSTVAVALNGSSTSLITLTNSGTINQTGTGRAIRDNVGNLNVQITNNAGALIQAKDADVIQMNVPSSTITLDNYGTFTSTNNSNGGAQAIDWAVLTSSNTLHNYSTGLLQANEADAVRLGLNGVLTNDGTIKSTNNVGSTSGSDGVDAQTNSGQSITNANSGTGPALIEGARHGITGGDVNGGIYTMSVTNKVGGTIQGDDGSGINIDGANNKETVTVINAGTITGKGVTADGDGVDVDGLVNIQNSGTIKSLNALNDTSEAITVGGGTIVNTSTGVIQGSISSPNGNTGTGRGITLSGVDKNAAGNPIPVQPIYANSSIDNSGLIKGDSNSAIAILGGASGFTTTITNQASGALEGGGTVPVIQTNANDVSVINYGRIESKGTGKAIDLGTGNNNTVQVIGGTASIIGDVSGATGTGSTFTISPGTGNNFNYAGSISNFSKVEVTSGHVTLSGVNSYTGVTKISGGTLSLSATSNNIASSSSILVGDTAAHSSAVLDVTGVTGGFTLASGQTLGGHGTVIGNLTFGSGAVLSPGNSVGTSTFNGNLTLGSGVSLVFDLAGTGASDKVIVSGGNLLTLNNQSISDFTFNLLSGYGVGTYTLIDDSTGTISGGLSTTPGSLTENLGGYNATLSLSGNNLLLTVAVVPEPGTWAMMLGGLALLVVIQYRRTKQA